MSEVRTIVIRIKERHLCQQVSLVLKDAIQLRNMIIITLRIARGENHELYKSLFDADIFRALLAERKGGKKANVVNKSREMISNTKNLDEIFSDAIKLTKHIDVKHVYKIIKGVIGEFKSFSTKIKKGEKASLPRAKKLREVSNMVLPLDKERVKFVDQGLRITVVGGQRILLPINRDKINKIISINSIQNYKLCFDGRDVSLNISYRPNINPSGVSEAGKLVGMDIGVNNLASLVFLDEKTPSLIVSGKEFKSYNQNFNRKKARLASKKDRLANELAEIEDSVWQVLNDENDLDEESIEDLIVWRHKKVQHDLLKKEIDRLYSQRKNYFRTNFHKIARRLLEHLQSKGVSCLVTSRNILEAKKRTNMGKVGNQRFVSIPFAILIDALKLYAIEYNLEVVDSIDEAYSSKTNALFGNVIESQSRFKNSAQKNSKLRATVFQGRRHKGAFFCSRTKKIWHSDLNGALNHIVIFLRRKDPIEPLKGRSFKLECPTVLKGRKLFVWLDQELSEPAAA